MRIGISVHHDRIAAVALYPDGTCSAYETLVVADGFEAALDRLFAQRGLTGASVRSITFDLSAVLDPNRTSALTVVRIAPRPPIDRGDEPLVGDAPIMHVRGGHTTLGEELAPFDASTLHADAPRIPAGSRVVITSVGALMNPAHELVAGEILLDHDATLGVTFSHAFGGNSFATRERTAVLNSALASGAEPLATSVALVAGRCFPEARLFVTRNDGGRVPLSRLPTAPVHSAFSGASIEFLGAAAFCRLNEGDLLLARGDDLLLGSLRAGVPAVMPQLARGGMRLATPAAHLVPATEILLNGRVPSPRLVRVCGAQLPDWLKYGDVVETEIDLRALGAACAPLSDWALGTVGAGSAAEMANELQAAEARVRARLAGFGAPPSSVRILESRFVATTYEHARVISVRVRGVAGDPVGGLLKAERTTHAVDV